MLKVILNRLNVLDEILNFIQTVSEGLLTYF